MKVLEGKYYKMRKVFTDSIDKDFLKDYGFRISRHYKVRDKGPWMFEDGIRHNTIIREYYDIISNKKLYLENIFLDEINRNFYKEYKNGPYWSYDWEPIGVDFFEIDSYQNDLFPSHFNNAFDGVF